MGSNTLFRKISSIAVAILLLIYVGYQIYRSQYTGFKTETAMYADLSASIDTTGFISAMRSLCTRGTTAF